MTRARIHGWSRRTDHWLIRLDTCFKIRYRSRSGWSIIEVRVPSVHGALVWPVYEEDWTREETCVDGRS